MEAKLDKYWIGILLGLIMPALVAYIYIDRNNLLYMFDLLGLDFKNNVFLGQVMILSVFPNLAFIFVCYTLELWRAAKGLLIAAIPYLMVSIWFMF